MEVQFGVYDTPQPKDRKKRNLKHARLLSKGTKRIDEITEFISQMSSLTPSDIKGTLEALFLYFRLHLPDGYNIELEGLGHFSLSLDTRLIKQENGKNKMKVTIDNVNFKCSPRLKKAIQRTHLKKVKRAVNTFPSQEDRKIRMIDFMKERGFMNIPRYTSLNGCSSYMATRDLKQFVEEKILIRSGRGTHKVYLLSEEG